MAKRVCLEPGCPTLTQQSRCPAHRRDRERARGTRQARGYGSEHDQLRAEYQRRMDAGERFVCWRKGEPIDTTNWTLGHCDDDRSMYHGPECPSCDYAVNDGRRLAGCPHPTHRISPRA